MKISLFALLAFAVTSNEPIDTPLPNQLAIPPVAEEACRHEFADRYRRCAAKQRCERPLLNPEEQEACEVCWDQYQSQLRSCASAEENS